MRRIMNKDDIWCLIDELRIARDIIKDGNIQRIRRRLNRRIKLISRNNEITNKAYIEGMIWTIRRKIELGYELDELVEDIERQIEWWKRRVKDDNETLNVFKELK